MPQLDRIDHAISDHGDVSEVTLTTVDGERLTFALSYRQVGTVLETFRRAAGEMAERLAKSGAPLKAEVAAAAAEARPVETVMFSLDDKTGDRVLALEGPELGLLTLRLPRAVAEQIALNLADAAGSH